ncbi:uncharacterized protein (DUF779 family) [Leucobacter exalbidus]|uniref:Uncharacterized protein (DUF779 family) n=1 Tax=Leucobacter exalbidus TaxID=662960 RepID=A0A940PQ73_9MICO|nr:DUF779 domain-containing protein [Leucobacter exalbidus]MBP1325594.1 uncharacterized protein (DUF779 family) [Leucobacter exalbidus]
MSDAPIINDESESCELPTRAAQLSAIDIAGCVPARPEVPGESASRLAFTPAALALIDKLWLLHGPLMFHQSGGCCDGSAPMCYQAGEFRTGGQDVLLGTLELPGLATDDPDPASPSPAPAGPAPREIGFWMSREQFAVWAHTHLTIDAVPGRGGGFSLEAPEGQRFLIRSRLL